MKIALAFDSGRQSEWQKIFVELNLEAITPIDYVNAKTVPELRAADAEIIVGYASGFLAAYLRNAQPSLKWVHFMNAGVDPVTTALDNQAPAYKASNVRGIHAEPMAEFVLMAMLHFAKRVPLWTRLQREHKWLPAAPRMLSGKSALVVGAGSIGTGIARACRALGMDVTGVATREGPRPHFDRIVTSMLGSLGAADYVICSLPLTPGTHRMFDKQAFSAMKPGAVFVNIGRGEMVDDDAIIEALTSGRLGGAVLDAFATEPLPDTSPLWDAPNLLLTPHVSGRFDGGPVKGAAIFAENFRRYVAGEPLVTPVDLVRGY